MSIPSSGSSTWRSASKTSSFVGISFECSDGPNGDVRCQADDVSLIAEEADFLAPLAGEEVYPVDEAHPIAARAHDERVRARRVGQEPHPAEQIAVRHTGRDHDHLARGPAPTAPPPPPRRDSEAPPPTCPPGASRRSRPQGGRSCRGSRPKSTRSQSRPGSA